MNPYEIIDHAKKIASQLPNPYTQGVFYPVTMPDGRIAEARRTNPGYIHLRRIEKLVLKSPSGEVINTSRVWVSYRINLRTGDIKDIGTSREIQ